MPFFLQDGLSGDYLPYLQTKEVFKFIQSWNASICNNKSGLDSWRTTLYTREL